MQKGINNQSKIDAKSMQENGMQKVLQTRSVTAAPLGHQPMKANRSEARNRQILAILAKKRGTKTCQNHEHITYMATKIYEKSMKNQG